MRFRNAMAAAVRENVKADDSDGVYVGKVDNSLTSGSCTLVKIYFTG